MIRAKFPPSALFDLKQKVARNVIKEKETQSIFSIYLKR